MSPDDAAASTSPPPPPLPPYTAADFAHSPFVVFYEVTRACDLLCLHCRACAQPNRHPYELDTAHSKALLDQFASFPKRPVLVFTGGDPMKRPDLFELIEHGVSAGLTVALTPSATPLLTADAIRRARDAGVSRLALSIDGVDAATHDGFRGVPGSFERTLAALSHARAIGLSVQVNTTITIRNVDQVDAMAEMLAREGIALWSVFFLIPVGRGLAEQRIAPAQYERVFEQLWEHSKRQPYAIKTTEAHHYRRFVLQRAGDPQRPGPAAAIEQQRTRPGLPGDAPVPGRIQRAPLGVNDGKGVMFVSHTGAIYPSGFLPVKCGKFPEESVVDVYRNSPVFQALRDGDRLKGKCGVCEFRQICGGSRARAFALTRDLLAPEPDCVYVPEAAKKELIPCSA